MGNRKTSNTRRISHWVKLECPLRFLYKYFLNNGYFVSRFLEKLGHVFSQVGGHLVVQLVSNYPSNLSCFFGVFFLKHFLLLYVLLSRLLDKSV